MVCSRWNLPTSCNSLFLLVLDNLKVYTKRLPLGNKYSIGKRAIAEFLATDRAFVIVNKSRWHLNTILQFSKKVHK